MNKKTKVALGLGVAVVAAIAISSAGKSDTPTLPSAAPSFQMPTYSAPAAVPAAEPVKAPSRTEFGPDGMYAIGEDVDPGRYKTTGPDGSSFGGCYWERAKDDSGVFTSIIANGNIEGPGSVTVSEGEFIKVRGGCTWAKK